MHNPGLTKHYLSTKPLLLGHTPGTPKPFGRGCRLQLWCAFWLLICALGLALLDRVSREDPVQSLPTPQCQQACFPSKVRREKSGVSFPSLYKYSSANKLHWEGSSLCGRGRCYSQSYFFLPKNKVPKSEDEKTKSLSISAPPGASCYHGGHLPGAESSWSASVHCFQIRPASHPPFIWSHLIRLQGLSLPPDTVLGLNLGLVKGRSHDSIPF